MDVQMPEMNGLEATTLIREREKETGERIPIIAMTANAMEGDRERCLEAGMDAYVSKPIRSRELFAAIEQFTQKTVIDPATAESLAFDARTLRETVGNAQLLDRILQLFPVEAAKLFSRSEEALARADDEGLREAVHSLKGLIGNLCGTKAIGPIFDPTRIVP